ncbi:MAG: hypothetical protein P4L54_04435 [Acidocella sp.]|nr:hypothetical protein [Acidocella sp.]
MITVAPLCSWFWIGALAAAAALLTALALRRQARGAIWRALGFALLLGILINPQRVRQITQPLPDIALILVDHSPPMQIGNRARLTAQAAAALQADNTITQTADVPEGGNLFASLNSALASIPPAQLAGVVAITDGEVADAPLKLSFNAPFSVLIPASGNQTDRELRLLQAPGFGVSGQPVTLTFNVLDHGGHDSGALAPVTITADGAPLWSQSVPVGQPVSVPVPVHPGPETITVSVAPLPGEVSPLNNQATFTLNGLRDHLNVLLLTGSPGLGVRSWRDMLLSDPSINLIHFVVMRAPGEIMSVDPQENAMAPLPVAQLFGTDLSQFNLIILDRLDPTGLLSADNLASITSYVQNGGALFDITGPEFSGPNSLANTPLGAVLPASPASQGALTGSVTSAFTPTITALGTRHPVTAPLAGTTLPPWYRMQAATISQGDILMTGADNLPLLVLTQAKQGRVAMLLSDQFWLWTRSGSTGPALPLLRHVVQWLLHDPAVQAESLHATIINNRLTITRQSLGSTVSPASITSPDGTTRTITLQPAGAGQFTASLPASTPGVWKITEDHFSSFAAASQGDGVEYQNLAATDAILGPLAQHVIWLGNTPTPKLEPLLRHRHASAVTSAQTSPLLPPFALMLAALTLLLLAWWRERG